jgi:protein SCO1
VIRRLTIAAPYLLAACLTMGGAPSRPRADALPYYVDSTRTPRWDVEPGAHRVADFALVDQEGRAVTARSLAGKVYVASFFYTTCRSLCPTVRSELATVRDAFRGDTSVAILSHTVTPEADGVAALAHYARLNNIGGGWHLLTGPRATIERLTRASYFVELADTTGNTLGALRHTETLVLVDGDGHVRGMYEGSLAYEVSQLIADMRRLRQPAR